MERFEITNVMGHEVSVGIYVYESLDGMRRAIKRNHFIWKKDTLAQVCPVVYENDKTKEKSDVCIVFFNKQHINEMIITHEAVHIALWIMRTKDISIRLGKEIDAKEEKMAHFICRVNYILTKQLRPYLSEEN